MILLRKLLYVFPGLLALSPNKANTATPPPPTYYGDVAAIIQANCVECHREAAPAPFPLDTLETVSKRKRIITEVLENNLMPPWFAASDVGHWANDRSLTAEEKRTILDWLRAGMPAGDPAKAPEPRKFPEEWHIGEGIPDEILSFEKPVTIPADGDIPYEYVKIKTRFPEDRWVQAVEIIPGEKAVVHHVSVMIDGAMGPGGAGIFAVYVPGSSYNSYPEGMAKKLPAGATLTFEMHYTPIGKEVQDTTRLGLVFSKEKPKKEVLSGAVADISLRIKAGEANHEEEGRFKLPTDARILSIMPHMHWRGKSFEMFHIDDEDKAHKILSIPRYDFNWQLTYHFSEPLTLPAGTVLKVKGVFDNSEDNPNNPDPTKTVRWGQQTKDEMLVGYFEYYVP